MPRPKKEDPDVISARTRAHRNTLVYCQEAVSKACLGAGFRKEDAADLKMAAKLLTEIAHDIDKGRVDTIVEPETGDTEVQYG